MRGLNTDADDYLTKPFSLDVLLARIHALARRGPSVQAVPLRVADLTLEPSTHAVICGDAVLGLARTESFYWSILRKRRQPSRNSSGDGLS